ncbi:hypothetical protein MTsPCn5_05490 [Croceitalea sp. MTPC5]|uniref:NACHT domain-containing protein n=1 Tax=Croceitalea sp. MTPC5 TaxID=3056565 RepID=UPI002B3A4D32|nr:hypothetical protein MTsPCn5_05490 [Croceitalea sp. MTPC5]
MAKGTTRNRKFASVKDKLVHINKNCHEPELFEDLKQLFRAKGFKNVEITHGSKEYGKDLVFTFYDAAFDETFWYGVIVKNKNARQNDFVNGGEIAQQIELAFNVPFLNSQGKKMPISRIFIVINGSVTDNAKEVLSNTYDHQKMSNIIIWDYQRLGNEIDTHIKELFLDNIEPVINVFAAMQIQKLSDISRTNQLFDLKIHEIDDIFVNVQTTYSRHLKKIDEYVQFNGDEPKKSNIKSSEEFDGALEILNSKKNFIVHGIATSGKTLLLKRLGIKALKYDKRNLAVFFFEAPDIVKKYGNGKFDVNELIKKQFSEYTEGELFKSEDFEGSILLFDSIDDVSNEEVKLNIFKTLDDYTKDEKNKFTQVVIATKTTETLDINKILGDFEKTELLPFNLGQALKLVNKIIPDNKVKSVAFTNAIKDSMLDSSILRTPLALTLMAILYRDGLIDLEELPANVTELYNKFVDTYLDRWDTNKGISQQYKYEQTKIILAFIAFEMHRAGINEISADELISKLKQLRIEYNYEELDDVETFVSHLKLKKGVFNYDEQNDEFYFFNHLFQEYFVSIHIDESSEAKLKDNFFDEWWENVIVFYCGKNPKRDIFLLDSSKKVIPTELKDCYVFLQLLSKCLQANHSISIKSRLEIIKRMVYEFDKFCILFLKEGKQGKTIAAASASIDVILSFRAFFEKLFSSKHISNKECFKYFEELLTSENSLSEATRYCIAHFYSFKTNDTGALEIFLKDEEKDIIWERMLYVDLNFLRFKKKDLKSYQRIKRKVNKNRFLIQSRLRSASTTILLDDVSEDEKE